MDTSDVIALAATCLSALALTYGWLANRKATRYTAQSNEMQGRLVEIEERREEAQAVTAQRAGLVLTLQSSPGRHGKDWRLILANHGEAEARNIEVTLDGTSIFDIGHVMTDSGEITLGAGNACRWAVAIGGGFRPPWQAIVNWEDDSGIPGEYKTTLTF